MQEVAASGSVDRSRVPGSADAQRHVPTDVAERACQELQRRPVVGVVLNAVEQSHTYGSYYYPGYGYGYGGTQTNKANGTGKLGEKS